MSLVVFCRGLQRVRQRFAVMGTDTEPFTFTYDLYTVEFDRAFAMAVMLVLISRGSAVLSEVDSSLFCH